MTGLRSLLAAMAVASVAQVVSITARAQQQPGGDGTPETAKIVGIGATSCSAFLDHIRTDPASERDYLAWAQGFMSGALLRAPEGVDRGLDLMPPAFPLRNQAGFLRRYCETHQDADYSDGVAELYRTLRAPPS